jgi:hypothetical protein
MVGDTGQREDDERIGDYLARNPIATAALPPLFRELLTTNSSKCESPLYPPIEPRSIQSICIARNASSP